MIQDLRRQYSGSIPLGRQEKLSNTMKELNEDKRRLAEALRAAEAAREEAEIRAGELSIKQVL